MSKYLHIIYKNVNKNAFFDFHSRFSKRKIILSLKMVFNYLLWIIVIVIQNSNNENSLFNKKNGLQIL